MSEYHPFSTETSMGRHIDPFESLIGLWRHTRYQRQLLEREDVKASIQLNCAPPPTFQLVRAFTVVGELPTEEKPCYHAIICESKIDIRPSTDITFHQYQWFIIFAHQKTIRPLTYVSNSEDEKGSTQQFKEGCLKITGDVATLDLESDHLNPQEHVRLTRKSSTRGISTIAWHLMYLFLQEKGFACPWPTDAGRQLLLHILGGVVHPPNGQHIKLGVGGEFTNSPTTQATFPMCK